MNGNELRVQTPLGELVAEFYQDPGTHQPGIMVRSGQTCIAQVIYSAAGGKFVARPETEFSVKPKGAQVARPAMTGEEFNARLKALADAEAIVTGVMQQLCTGPSGPYHMVHRMRWYLVQQQTDLMRAYGQGDPMEGVSRDAQ